MSRLWTDLLKTSVVILRGQGSRDRKAFGRDALLSASYIKEETKLAFHVFLDALAWNEDDIISDLLDEIYEALHNDARRLAAMGVRSLLEQIMIDKVGQQKSFKLLVNTFAEKGFISPLQKERIETILEAGHASVHRSFKPHVRDLMTLMDIAESLVADIYVHPRRVEQLTSKIPTRGVKSTD